MKTSTLALAFTLLAVPVAAEEVAVVHRLSEPGRLWTAEDFARAKPMPLPRRDLDPATLEELELGVEKEREKALSEEPAPFVEVYPSLAQPPTLSGEERFRFRRRLFDFSPEELRRLRGQDAAPVSPELEAKNRGTGGLDYTSSILMPRSANTFFPYSAVGKLFFSDDTGDFVCSGAVIEKRLVLTAGHCVYGDGELFRDFLFVPAYDNGEAPLGAWQGELVTVSGAWIDDDEVPNPEDWALIQVADQDGTSIFEVAGRLSFTTGLLADNHLTLLGYPGNLDGGERMHQVWSGDWFDFGDNTVVYGSDMSGGSSGGPWVQNFNRKAQGQGGGRQGKRISVVGVASYGFSDEAILVQGASNFNRNFRVLRNIACSEQPDNC